MDQTDLKTLTEEAQTTSDRVHELLSSERSDGFRRSGHSPEALDAFMEIIEQASQGSAKALYALNEASQLSDFPYLFGDTLDRATMAYYQAWIPNWRAFCRVGPALRDFRLANQHNVFGMGAVLDALGEREEYPERHPSEERVQISVGKYGAKWGVSFEALINDDLGQLADLPQNLAMAARRTEAVKVSEQYVGASGPNTSLYTSGNKNIVNTTNGASSTNPALSTTALGEALFIMSKQLDADGHPILIDGATLVVPPALEVTANNILNAIQVNVATGGGAYNGSNQIVVNNWLSGRLSLVVDPYIPYTASTANGNTSWFVFANPLGGNRPAIQYRGLMGHEAPELFVKAPNAQRVGGGGSVAEDFDYDMNWFKVRHIFGVGQVDGKLTAMSNGSGS